MEDWSEKNKKEIQILKKKAYLVGSILGCVVGVLGIIITIDGYFELGLKPWDIAAGELIVKEAGGTVVDARGGSDSMENGQVLACSMKMLKPLMKAVVPAWGEAAK